VQPLLKQYLNGKLKSEGAFVRVDESFVYSDHFPVDYAF
jgi:hypothetical protein